MSAARLTVILCGFTEVAAMASRPCCSSSLIDLLDLVERRVVEPHQTQVRT